MSAGYPGRGGRVDVLAPVVAELSTTLFTTIVSGVAFLLDSTLNSNYDGLNLPFQLRATIRTYLSQQSAQVPIGKIHLIIQQIDRQRSTHSKNGFDSTSKSCKIALLVNSLVQHMLNRCSVGRVDNFGVPYYVRDQADINQVVWT